jgi:lysozyme family protein
VANYRNQVDFIKKWEGGLSNDQRDIGPASHPAPCVYNGQVGWHTNKGIIYATFESNASKLGYVASCENFFTMPDYIWLKIYKAGFWDAFLLDGYHSQSIADIVVSLTWGSGKGGAYKQLAKFLNANYGTDFPTTTSSYNIDRAKKMRDLFNHITRTARAEKIVQQKLIAHLKQFYISLNNPTYIKGWLNRVNALDEFTYASLRAVNAIRKFMLVGLVGSAVAAITLATYFILEENNSHRLAA